MLPEAWEADSEGRPLLAIVCACARDPLLRMTASVILEAPVVSVVGAVDFSDAVREAAPHRFSPTNLKAIGNRTCFSWTQSGHLIGGKTRTRAHPVVSAVRSERAHILSSRPRRAHTHSFWADLPVLAARSYSPRFGRRFSMRPEKFYTIWPPRASRRGWIDLRRAGSVVDVSFSKLLTPQEEEAQ